MSKSLSTIPVLDFGEYFSDRDRFVNDLRSACHRVGFFLLRHHLPESLAQRQLEEARSIERKMTLSYENSPSFRGFMRLGVENTGGKTDIREQIEFGKEYKEELSTSPDKPLYERLMGENQWPESFQPHLKECTMEYVANVCRIADCLRKALCLALGLSEKALDSFFKEPHWFLKLISYPPCSEDDGHQSFGVGPHTDTNCVTLVLQDQVGGLQVYSQGEWIDVPTNMGEDLLVCNLGEQAEMFSGGYFLATPHRVLANSGSKQARVSVPLFYNPSLSTTVSSIVTNVDELPWERSKDYDRKDHWRMEGNTMLETVGDNTFKSLARSHPSVFAKHHKDLTQLQDGRIVEKCQKSTAVPPES